MTEYLPMEAILKPKQDKVGLQPLTLRVMLTSMSSKVQILSLIVSQEFCLTLQVFPFILSEY